MSKSYADIPSQVIPWFVTAGVLSLSAEIALAHILAEYSLV